jgi:pseudaminic acid cytidylyltransferase
MKTLAIITARGGSKRIPKKNIKLFLGEPIIKYSIEAAINSNIFDEVIVSTDDVEIANIAKDYGAAVPFMRSEKNSDDTSTTADVLLEVIDSYKKISKEFDYICCIYPTAPFVTSEKLKYSLNKLIIGNYKSVLPVVKFSFPILRSFKIENDVLELNWPEYFNSRSQDLPEAYHDAGQFYFFRSAVFKQEKKIITDNTFGILIPESEAQDIDTYEDWLLAEIKYKLFQDKSPKSTNV